MVDGLVCKNGQRIVIPSKLRRSCLRRLHIAHLGNKTLCQTRQFIFWPGLSKNITDLISACPASMKYAAKNCAEPLINDLAATKPWQALSIDNFEWKGHKYLIILDRFSHFVVVKSSDRIDTATTIRLLLEVSAEHGLPQKFRCDRGTNFTSPDFTNFCSDLGITLSFSSSYHHQFVPAECSVHTVKNIMKKCNETGKPWCLGLLEYLCTPLDEKTPSPSNLIGHQFKGLCPTFSSLQESQEGTLEHLIEKLLREKLYHDKKSRTLADIQTGSTAVVLDHMSNTWTVGHILDRSNRSYTVELPNDKVIHHNRVDLRPTSVQFQPISTKPVSVSANVPDAVPQSSVTPSKTDSLTVSHPPKAPTPSKSYAKAVMESQLKVARPTTNVKDAVITTRSGRVVRPPPKLNLQLLFLSFVREEICCKQRLLNQS